MNKQSFLLCVTPGGREDNAPPFQTIVGRINEIDGLTIEEGWGLGGEVGLRIGEVNALAQSGPTNVAILAQAFTLPFNFSALCILEFIVG